MEKRTKHAFNSNMISFLPNNIAQGTKAPTPREREPISKLSQTLKLAQSKLQSLPRLSTKRILLPLSMNQLLVIIICVYFI